MQPFSGAPHSCLRTLRALRGVINAVVDLERRVRAMQLQCAAIENELQNERRLADDLRISNAILAEANERLRQHEA